MRLCLPCSTLPVSIAAGTLLGLFAVLMPVVALAEAPAVTNVLAVQRPGTRFVDVTYDLDDPDGDAMTVSLRLSPDGGQSFPVPCVAVSGHVGAGIMSGAGRHIVWDAGVDYPGHVGDNYVVKVIADDGHGMVLVSAGIFTMGSPTSELCRFSNETQHQVTLTWGFYVGLTEVTQAQWLATMGWNASLFAGPNRPVEMITWFDAVSYCNQKSVAEGFTPAYTITDPFYSWPHLRGATVTWNQSADGYRLLTEAEWEYACRATSSGAFCNGGISQCDCGYEPYLSAVGWYCGNAGGQTHDVAQKVPNYWGLYDMHGNVNEWCWDWYGSYGGPVTDPTGPGSGSLRVRRGGSWYDGASGCRSAVRNGSAPDWFYANVGLRLARAAF